MHDIFEIDGYTRGIFRYGATNAAQPRNSR
jgi:hypothetical protein